MSNIMETTCIDCCNKDILRKKINEYNATLSIYESEYLTQLGKYINERDKDVFNVDLPYCSDHTTDDPNTAAAECISHPKKIIQKLNELNQQIEIVKKARNNIDNRINNCFKKSSTTLRKLYSQNDNMIQYLDDITNLKRQNANMKAKEYSSKGKFNSIINQKNYIIKYSTIISILSITLLFIIIFLFFK